MDHFKKNRPSGSSFVLGFTLIELLVVMSIISLMSSMVLTATNSTRIKARDAGRIAQIKEVSKALALYQSTYNTYPVYDPTLDTEVPQYWQTMIQDLVNAKFLSATFVKADPVIDDSGRFSFIKMVHAAALAGPSYYPCSIQDPLYKVAEDYLVSYGYTSTNSGSGYILRIRLEDTGHKALNSSKTGAFVDVSTTGQDACDKTLGYYCISS